MTQAKRYQGGSIISFIIVTIVIAALLIGGVVWMRHRGTVAREQSTEVATQQNGQDASENGSEGANGEGGENSDDLYPAGRGDSDESTEGSGAGSSSVQGGATPEQTQQADNDAAGSTSQPAQLPATGPAEAITSLVALAALTYVAARYFAVRRELARAIDS